MSNNNEDLTKYTSVDDDDEFGGGKLTPQLIYGEKYQKPLDLSVTQSEPDEDDEFGGAKLTPTLIYGKDKYPGNQSKKTVNESEEEIDPEKPIFTCDYDIFSPHIPVNQWYVDRENLTNSAYYGLSLTIPLVVDTEFTDQNKKEYQQKSRLGLTTQISGIVGDGKKAIFALDPRVNAGRMLSNSELLPMAKTDFHPVDYLQSLGLEVEIWEATESELKDLPKCNIVLYGHFLTAEINMIASGSVKERIRQLQQSKDSEQITSGRRLHCQYPIEDQILDWVSLKHIICIEGYCYELCIKLVDTGAIIGAKSFKEFADTVGWILKHKDNFTSEEKGKMLDMAIERFQDFEEYSLGDLDVYEVLNNFYEKWKLVYEKLGLDDYFQAPKLTIGGTVKDLFEAALAEKLGISAKDEEGNTIWRKQLTEIIDLFVKPSSASELRQYSTSTRALLAKVEGGRCRNNRPTDIFKLRKIKGKFDAVLICDIDISGCYGEGQRNQNYFLGNPEIFDYKATQKNEYITLRQWLKSYDVKVDVLIKAVKEKDKTPWNNPNNWGELISGGWYARIRTMERLKYPQDYFASWFTETSDRVDLLAKTLRKMKCDTELVSTDWVDFDEEVGSLKIFNYEILNGVLTHDGLQWILAICSPRQRNELLDKVQILASSVYPRSQKIDVETAPKALEKLKDTYRNWKGGNTTERVKVNGRAKIVQNFDECHAWFGINLGELLINDLLIERKKAQKVYGKKSPLDLLFKLCVNTLYGDMVSKYFVTSNPVVGNNITARARCLAWLMEKGLHGWQSITDGCAFELNGVMHPLRDELTGELINQHRKGSKLNQRKVKRAPLGEVQEILGYWQEYQAWNSEKSKGETKYAFGLKVGEKDISPVIIADEDNEGYFKAKLPALKWIDTTTMNHLQKQFPLIDVLHNDSTSISIDDDLNPQFESRKGQFSFETKDVYHSGSFHGSANYLLENPNGKIIKARAYEVKREHYAFDEVHEGDEVVFYKSDRYGKESNPAKDLMIQLLQSPENIKRQLPAVKSGILKVKDYKNLSDKYDYIGIEPGDTILRALLMKEFSLSQFTFDTYEQYMMWKTMITSLNDKDKQSLEGFFLNEDSTLNFLKMCEWVDEQISLGVDKPFDILCDKNRNDRRSEKRSKTTKKKGKGANQKRKVVSLSHPHLDVYNALREKLKDIALGEIHE